MKTLNMTCEDREIWRKLRNVGYDDYIKDHEANEFYCLMVTQYDFLALVKGAIEIEDKYQYGNPTHVF